LACHILEILALATMHSEGIDAYRKTREVFFALPKGFATFNIKTMNVTAGDEVALAGAWRCAGIEPDGGKAELQFRRLAQDRSPIIL
jgi:ketosteroid isomerase-like protein